LAAFSERHSEEVRNDLEAQKEFELLGAHVAVPILDRETVLGVAVFDGRITGEPLVNSELELIFHLLEQLALAVKTFGSTINWLQSRDDGRNSARAHGRLRCCKPGSGCPPCQ